MDQHDGWKFTAGVDMGKGFNGHGGTPDSAVCRGLVKHSGTGRNSQARCVTGPDHARPGCVFSQEVSRSPAQARQCGQCRAAWVAIPTREDEEPYLGD